MHKLYLTNFEASIIGGAEAIITKYGGFPSMENGSLCALEVERIEAEQSFVNVKLVFDIRHWHEVCSLYHDLPALSHRYIEISFHKAKAISFDHAPIGNIGEIQFENTANQSHWRANSLPFQPIMVERPYCVFHIRRDLRIDFHEKECQITAISHNKLRH